jgi:hypothetical protein
MNDTDRDRMVERAVNLLDASSASLDAATLSRLNRARHGALASRRRTRRWASGGFAVIGASAIALVLAFGLQRTEPMRDAAPSIPAALVDEDTPPGDELDLYENTEFYAWLEDQPTAIDGSGAAQIRRQ